MHAVYRVALANLLGIRPKESSHPPKVNNTGRFGRPILDPVLVEGPQPGL